MADSAYRLKRLGVYTNLIELQQVFRELTSVLDNEQLLDGKKVVVRLQGEPQAHQLIADNRLPGLVPETELSNSLFITDVVSLLTGVAINLAGLKLTDQLPEFNRETPNQVLLDEWGEDGESGTISRESFFKLKEFVGRLDTIFTTLSQPQTQTAQEIVSSSTATVPVSQQSKSNSSSSSFGGKKDDEQAEADEPNEQQITALSQNVAFIFAAADRLLIKNLLENAGISEAALPPELQAQVQALRATLLQTIKRYMDSLSPEELNQLLSAQGQISLRLAILRQVLTQLMADATNPFYIQLTSFYEQYVKYVSLINPAIKVTDTIDEIARVVTSEEFENEELAQIREKFLAWKQAFIARLEQERSTLSEEDLIQDVLPAPPETALEKKITDAITTNAPQVLSTSQTQQLSEHLNTTAPNYDEKVKAQIQTQSNRLVWGALAELFREDDIKLSTVNNPIFSSVQSQALKYVLALSPEELNKLRTSPSSLIRHIKNLRGRVLVDAQFVSLYQAFQASHDTPIISRANRVEKETNWGYTQLNFELFGAHNITDETTPDEAGLQDLFDDIKTYLQEKVFIFFDQLPEKDLQQLYIRASERQQVLKKLHEAVESDLTFTENLSRFYQNFLDYLGANQKTAQQTQLLQSLQRTVSREGVRYHLKATTQATPAQLFNENVLTTINSDNPVLMKTVSTTLDSMILTYGLQETKDIINNVQPDLLEITFGLPKGSLTPSTVGSFRSALSEYTATRTAHFSSIAGSEETRGIFGSTSELSNRPDYATVTPDTYFKRLEPIKTVREVVQNTGGEEVAQATSKVSQKEKAQIFFKMYETSWNSLSQEQQIAIYLYYDKPISKQVQTDVRNNLPIPIEFIDFQAKNRDGKLLSTLVSEYQRHGTENFSAQSTRKMSAETVSTVEEFQRIEQLRASLTLSYLQEMAAEEQAEIARINGYESATQLIELLEAQTQQAGSLDYSIVLPTLPDMVEGAGDYLPAPSNTSSFFSRLNQFRQSGQGRKAGIPSTLSKLNRAFKKISSKGVAKQAAQKGVGMAAKAGLGAATAGIATVGLTLLENKKFRQLAVYGGSFLVGQTIYALSTIGGAIMGTLGGILGFTVGGPLGSLFGTMAGANLGASWIPQQWGSAFGFTPRQPPGLESIFSSQQPIGPAEASMSAMRSAQAAGAAATAGGGAGGAAATSNAAGVAAANPLSVSAAAPSSLGVSTTAASSLPSATTVSTTLANAASSMSGWLTGLSLAVMAPMLAVFGMILITMYVIMAIAGAFIVPMPTRDSNWKDPNAAPDSEQPGAKFLTVTKVASPAQIPNQVETMVTYTITVTPKGNHSILVKRVTDTFNQAGAGGPEISSGFGIGAFPTEAFNRPLVLTYTVPLGKNMTDILITNTLTLTFEVYDINGFVINRNQTYNTSASVRVGNPKEGCWPTSGKIVQMPYGSYTHSPTRYNSDAYDIVNNEGTPIYAPFSGEICKQPYDHDGYGNWVRLQTTINGRVGYLIFAHFSKITKPLTTGTCEQISTQELIGYMGNTGNSTGPHLHYELKPSPLGGLQLSDLVPHKTNGSKPSLGDIVNDCK